MDIQAYMSYKILFFFFLTHCCGSLCFFFIVIVSVAANLLESVKIVQSLKLSKSHNGPLCPRGTILAWLPWWGSFWKSNFFTDAIMRLEKCCIVAECRQSRVTFWKVFAQFCSWFEETPLCWAITIISARLQYIFPKYLSIHLDLNSIWYIYWF